LPAKSASRRHALESLIDETSTMIFYEAPHRLMDTLKDMADVFGGTRSAVIARELTKVHESIIAGDLNEHVGRLSVDANSLRGEIVVLIAGCEKEKEEKSFMLPKEEVLDLLLAELPLKRAVVLASQLTGIRKNIFYKMALIKKEQ
jgi:16S rRNA (cytidine1402-2'-O)-methyltransferase